MFAKTTLKTKLLTIGLIMTLVPLGIFFALVLSQNNEMYVSAEEESLKLAYADLDHIADGIYHLCETQDELLRLHLTASANVARKVLEDNGDIALSDVEMVNWSANDQFTKDSIDLELPKMMVGDVWLGQNSDAGIMSPVVDEVKQLVNGTCTIFQRMNEEGDMLRVSTNVEKMDGTRAIGTYIPRTNPDGKANPVVSALLNGKTFQGRSFVVNEWYLAFYEPIKDASGRVIGALYFGVPQESIKGLRQAVSETKVGKTGYVYILDSKGRYVMSKDGKRDGEDIWNAKDDNGVLFIQEVCMKALNLSAGEIAEQQYPWRNKGDSEARMKVVRVVYYEPWDWVIGVGSYLDEFLEVNNKILAVSNRGNLFLTIVTIVTIFIAGFTWYLIARRITGRINHIVSQLSAASTQVTSASQQTAQSGQIMAEGANDQASSLEEISSSLEELSSMTRQNADNTKYADTLASGARDATNTGEQALAKLLEAIDRIKASSDETAKIVKTIDEIAFQTNLLALNAAVEAARAGEAGKGFAVVAEEVRNLAQRSAEAAKSTSELIEGSQNNADSGVVVTQEVSSSLEHVVESVQKVSSLISEVSAASQEQTTGIEQINEAVSRLDKVNQENAANAEESASASEELSSQARELKNTVHALASIIGGNHNNSNGHLAEANIHALPSTSINRERHLLK